MAPPSDPLNPSLADIARQQTASPWQRLHDAIAAVRSRGAYYGGAPIAPGPPGVLGPSSMIFEPARFPVVTGPRMEEPPGMGLISANRNTPAQIYNQNAPNIKKYTDALELGKITPQEFEGFMDALGVDKSVTSKLSARLLRQREDILKSVRGMFTPDQRYGVLNKLIANRDFVPVLRNGRMYFRSLTPYENETMSRIGWSRAPNVEYEQEISSDPLTLRRAWERNIRHWYQLATPAKD